MVPADRKGQAVGPREFLAQDFGRNYLPRLPTSVLIRPPQKKLGSRCVPLCPSCTVGRVPERRALSRRVPSAAVSVASASTSDFSVCACSQTAAVAASGVAAGSFTFETACRLEECLARANHISERLDAHCMRCAPSGAFEVERSQLSA